MERDAVTAVDLLVFPPNGLPLDLEKGFTKEWARLSQHVIHHFTNSKIQTTYNPHSTKDIANRITIGQSAFTHCQNLRLPLKQSLKMRRVLTLSH